MSTAWLSYIASRADSLCGTNIKCGGKWQNKALCSEGCLWLLAKVTNTTSLHWMRVWRKSFRGYGLVIIHQGKTETRSCVLTSDQQIQVWSGYSKTKSIYIQSFSFSNCSQKVQKGNCPGLLWCTWSWVSFQVLKLEDLMTCELNPWVLLLSGWNPDTLECFLHFAFKNRPIWTQWWK